MSSEGQAGNSPPGSLSWSGAILVESAAVNCKERQKNPREPQSLRSHAPQ